MDFPFMANISEVLPALMTSHPAIALPYVTLLGLFAFVGTLGNILVIGTNLTAKKKDQMVGDIFIVNLAMSDMLVTALINPVAIMGVSKGAYFYDGKPRMCVALGSICIASCVVSLLSIGCIGINRYVFVCHNQIYAKIYTRTTAVFMCGLTWAVGFLLDMPSHVGWSRHTFDTKTKKCLFDRSYQYYYTLFFVLCGVGIPLIILSVAYTRIFMHLHAAKESLMKTASKPPAGNSGKSGKSAFRQSMKQAKMMLAIFLAFVLLWSPYLFVLVIDRYDTFPIYVHLYASLFAHMHASVNFIIYGVANKNTRIRYKQFISEKLLCRHFVVRVEPENSTGGSVNQNN